MTPRILIVDDDPLCRKVMRLALEGAGYTVADASDGAGALAEVRARRPDLVLQDIVLPDVNGLELAARLHEATTGAPMPVVGVSGLFAEGDRRKLSERGFSAFLLKPVSPRALVEAVKAQVPLDEEPVASPGHGRRIVVADDDPVQRKLMALQLARYGYQVVTGADGAEALAEVRRERPDAVVSDVLMPVLDGFKLCMELRSDPAFASLPVLLCTSRLVEPLDRALAEQAGASGYLVREAGDPSRLLDALQAILDTPAPGLTRSADELERSRLERIGLQLERLLKENADLSARRDLMSAQLDALAKLSEHLDGKAGAREAMGDLFQRSMELCGTAGTLYLRREGMLVLVASHGHDRTAAEGWFGDQELLEQATEGTHPLAVHSPAVRGEQGARLLAWLGTPHGLLVPLRVEGRASGLLVLGAALKLDDDRLRFGRALASHVALAQVLLESLRGRERAEQLYASLMELEENGVGLADERGNIVEINRGWERLIGRAREEVIGKPFAPMLAAEEREAQMAKFHDLGRTGHFTVNGVRFPRPDGSVAVADVAVTRAILDGRPVAMTIAHDVTDRTRLEEQLRQAQKMEAVGQLAGGVAHDFNNMLAIILPHVEFIAEATAEGDPRRDDLEEIRQAAERASHLTRQLTTFSRKQVQQLASVPLNTVVTDLWRMVTRVIGEQIEAVAELSPEAGYVRVDRGQIEQVLMNLALNARDAMPDGGRLTLKTKNVTVDEGYSALHAGVPPGKYVKFSVADSGVGMSAEVRARLFEPFFTTKGPGKGTGLGLATAYGIIKQSGGHIWVYSEPGRGSVFKVYLPRVQAPNVAEAASIRPAAAEGRGESVLLLEDDERVRATVERLLAGRGYQVAAAASLDDAIGRIEGGARFHLLVSDVVMPGASGPVAAARLVERCPGMRVLFMSGFSDQAVVSAGLLLEGAEFIQKPFLPEALAAKVREILDRRD